MQRSGKGKRGLHGTEGQQGRRRTADSGSAWEWGGSWEEQRRNPKLLDIPQLRAGMGTLALLPQEVSLSPAFIGVPHVPLSLD